MADRRSILGMWLIERGSGRNLVARAYDGIDIDMDLIAPFLSATHTFIDKASNETLKTIDTENSRYVWEANEHLLFVMVISKAARIGHMRFMLEYALNEFINNFIPQDTGVANILKEWHGDPTAFREFGLFLDELVAQYEETDECLLAGKSMDCLEVYNHIFREIMKIDMETRDKQNIARSIRNRIGPLNEKYEFLEGVPIDGHGIEVLEIDVAKGDISYRSLRNALEELLRITAEEVQERAGLNKYRHMVFEHLMPYVKRDIQRLQTYAILDDVVRYLF
ncbi:hypothetical protein EU545_04900 [Candidatus Thorarchaeota archaeon]|nr:MAG: hypothetical protein EU545_04900 [Candidatus Thorarchaeota archaeon]